MSSPETPLPEMPSPEKSPSEKTVDKLVYMANQIGKFFASQSEQAAVSGTAEHIRKFWDPRMRRTIFACLDSGGADLDANVRKAIESLKEAAEKS